MKKKIFSLALVVIMTMTILVGCSSSDASASNLTKVTLNEVAHSIFYAPMYVAVESGYFKEEGIELTLVTGYGADKTMAAVLSGEANIGFMGSEASIYTYQGGAEDYVVNFAQLTQRAGNFVVAREPMENFTWDQLAGKNILGGRAGGMPEMVFEYVLKKNNLDPKTDVVIDQGIDFGSTAAAFSGGQGDFSIEFEPHATALEQKGDGYVVESIGEGSGYVPYTAFCAKTSYLAENQEVVQGFTNALQKGMEFVANHTAEEIANIIQPQFKETDLATITTIVKRYQEQDTWKGDLIFSQDSFALLQDILLDAEVIKEKVPYDNLVMTNFAEAALKK